MHILQEDNGAHGSFFVEENGNRVGELAYTWRSDRLISIDHTEVDESYEGKGLGAYLVEHAVTFARQSGLKMILYCSFAKKSFLNDMRSMQTYSHPPICNNYLCATDCRTARR